MRLQPGQEGVVQARADGGAGRGERLVQQRGACLVRDQCLVQRCVTRQDNCIGASCY